MTFEPWEIVTFANASADDDDTYGVGVVEAVYAELPLTDLMSRHTADLLTTGGRLAGMMWPRERALGRGRVQRRAAGMAQRGVRSQLR